MCYKLTATKVHLEEEKFLAEYKNVFKNPAIMEKIWFADGFAHPDLPVITVESRISCNITYGVLSHPGQRMPKLLMKWL